MEKHSVSRFSYLFRHLHLLSSDSFSSLIFSLLLFSSLTLPTSAFPSVHIFGSLICKFPSMISMISIYICICIHTPIFNYTPSSDLSERTALCGITTCYGFWASCKKAYVLSSAAHKTKQVATKERETPTPSNSKFKKNHSHQIRFHFSALISRQFQHHCWTGMGCVYLACSAGGAH